MYNGQLLRNGRMADVRDAVPTQMLHHDSSAQVTLPRARLNITLISAPPSLPLGLPLANPLCDALCRCSSRPTSTTTGSCRRASSATSSPSRPTSSPLSTSESKTRWNTKRKRCSLVHATRRDDYSADYSAVCSADAMMMGDISVRDRIRYTSTVASSPSRTL